MQLLFSDSCTIQYPPLCCMVGCVLRKRGEKKIQSMGETYASDEWYMYEITNYSTMCLSKSHEKDIIQNFIPPQWNKATVLRWESWTNVSISTCSVV